MFPRATGKRGGLLLKIIGRYLAVGLSIGLTTSLVFASWILARAYAESKSLQSGTPEALAEVLLLRSDTLKALSTLTARPESNSEGIIQLAERLSDIAQGLEGLRATFGGNTTLLADALSAEHAYILSLSELLAEDLFEINQARVEKALDLGQKASDALGLALQASGLRVEEGDPLRQPHAELAAVVDWSQRINKAAHEVTLVVTQTTENSIEIKWRARPVADWSGIWLTVDGGEPIFVSSRRYAIEGLAPLQSVVIGGTVALGPDGHLTGPAAAPIQAAAGHPPYSEAWLGNGYFPADFRVNRESYREISVGQSGSGSLSFRSSCSRGACPAALDLWYDLFYPNYSDGQLRLDGDEYVLTVSGLDLGTQGSCDVVGTRTVRFVVTDAAMINGVWTATELRGTVNHFSSACLYDAYLDSTFTAYLLEGE